MARCPHSAASSEHHDWQDRDASGNTGALPATLAHSSLSALASDKEDSMDKSVASAYDAESTKAGKEILTNQLQFVDFKPLTESEGWLGIGHSMQARFIWTPTLRSLINNSDAVISSDGIVTTSSKTMLPMISVSYTHLTLPTIYSV